MAGRFKVIEYYRVSDLEVRYVVPNGKAKGATSAAPQRPPW